MLSLWWSSVVCIDGGNLDLTRIRDAGKTTVSALTTIAIPHADNEDRTKDGVVEKQCFTT